MSNYIDQAYLEDAGLDLSDYDSDQIETAIDLAEATVERITGDKFYSIEDTKYFDGNGKRVLFFAPRTFLSLLSATSVDIVDPTDDTVDTELTEDTHYKIGPHGRYIELLRAMEYTPRTWLGYGTWPEGTRNVRIIGTWGWSSTPEPIKWACALLVAQKLDPDFSGLKGSIKSQRWSDYAVTYNSRRSRADLTGQVDAILSQYSRRKGLITVI